MLLIEKTLPGDARQINKLESECYQSEDVFSVSRLRYLFSSECTVSFKICDENGTILGNVIGLIRRFSIPSGRIYKITVSHQIAGQGWATKLLKATEKCFAELGMKKCCAEVRVSNTPSRKLFEKNNYTEYGKLEKYYPNSETAIKFWKQLLVV
ncbi:MAG: GNAT family N-acetyltransferase [Candidatus Riflebacteria bacterium]|nr:GNAT family N-acetyltransferase [Candidatus Riflebacteria bacterium]